METAFDRSKRLANTAYWNAHNAENPFDLSAFKARAAETRRVRALRAQALANPKLRHKFAESGHEFFVAGWQEYKNDVRIDLRRVVPATGVHVFGVRGKIAERSSASRKRLSFTVSNSSTPILGMIVLTWRDAPEDGKVVKAHLKSFFDTVRRKFEKRFEWLWWLEFQRRGAPHIHILTSGSIHDELGTVVRARRGKCRTLFTGESVTWLGDSWLRIIGAEHCEASRKFTAGGIWERFDKPDGAARYCAKDAWKPHQTEIPPDYQNVGAWWHRSRGFAAPVPLVVGEGGEGLLRARLNLKPDDKLHSVMFGKAATLENGCGLHSEKN